MSQNREMNGATVSADTETMRSVMRSQDLRDELLPGIPNDVTQEVIAPMLSWREVRLLSEGCPVWRRAIRGHLVYDSRVRSHGTEKLSLVVISKQSQDRRAGLHLVPENTMSLYSASEVDAWSGISWRDHVVSAVGKELSVYGSYAVLESDSDAEDEVNLFDRDDDAKNELIDPDETNDDDAERSILKKSLREGWSVLAQPISVR